MNHPRVNAWYAARGWTPFQYQRDAWRAQTGRRSGLIHAPTGTGKTLAALFGPVVQWLDTAKSDPNGVSNTPTLRMLWITPMRALANDILDSLGEPLADLEIPWRVEKRTGDTAGSVKTRQRRRMPTLLVTTPESLTILLSYPEAVSLFRSVRFVIVDEWHELLGTKRGVQTELALARLRTLAPQVRTWGLSATIGNVDEAARALVGTDAPDPVVIRGAAPKTIDVECILPDDIERFPWAGHLGTRLAEKVIARIESAATTLLFTNTRAQAEIWFRELIHRRPDLVGKIALHHGSLDRDIRARVETMLRTPDGGLRCVVCTSSLDLGVDFSPVDQVIQVGSPKGVARLIQRAGRSGHQPGVASRVIGVPTNALELIEFAAARDAIARGEIERRAPVAKPLDVLSQHLVTAAMGGGFDEAALRREVRSTSAYRNLTDREWQWTMEFVHRGGPTLGAYPEYARITSDTGHWKVADRRIATRHRMNIGTIVSDASVVVQYANGRTLGTTEESFVARLRKGERFVFAGRLLEFVRLHRMTATVRRVTGRRGAVPRWQGGKMPLSTRLAEAVRARIGSEKPNDRRAPEMEAVRPLLDLQRSLSRLPRERELLIETIRLRDGYHAFVFPFGGQLAHEGLGAVISLRLTRRFSASITAVVNDYGLEFTMDDALPLDKPLWRELLSPMNIVDDLLAAVNASELARRQFREIARIAGLIHQGYPGEVKPNRHLQASSDMFYEVFEQFDPENLLLAQARREVLEGQLEAQRLRDILEACADRELILMEPRSVTPLAFPLLAETMRATTVSSEAWEDRIRRMIVRLENSVTTPSRSAGNTAGNPNTHTRTTPR